MLTYPTFSNWLVRRLPRLAVILARAHANLVRMSGGRVGRRFLGAPMLLLRTVGRRSGKMRQTPTLYLRDGDRFVVVAANAAAATTPAWFLNLIAAGRGEVVIAGETIPVEAREADAEERRRLWPSLVEMYGGLDRYTEMTERRFPIAILTPSGGGAGEPN